MGKKYSETWRFGLRRDWHGNLWITEEFGKDGYVVIGRIDEDYSEKELYHLFKDLKEFIRTKKRIRKF